MSIVAFDTLKFVETLEAAGITCAYAKATAQAVAEGFVMAELATKSDLVLAQQGILLDLETGEACWSSYPTNDCA